MAQGLVSLLWLTPICRCVPGAGGSGGGDRRLAAAAASLAEHDAAAVSGLAAWLGWPASALTEPNPKLTKVLKRRLAPQVIHQKRQPKQSVCRVGNRVDPRVLAQPQAHHRAQAAAGAPGAHVRRVIGNTSS